MVEERELGKEREAQKKKKRNKKIQDRESDAKGINKMYPTSVCVYVCVKS